jgi:hypothetical protein
MTTPYATMQDLIKSADPKSRLLIVGTNPLIPELEHSAEYFRKLLATDRELELFVFYESDNENFAQAVAMDAARTRGVDDPRRMTFDELNTIHRTRIAGSAEKAGLAAEIELRSPNERETESLADRVSIRELHLRIPANLIVADDKIWFCVTTNTIPEISSYVEAIPGDGQYERLKSFVDFLLDPERVDVFTSVPKDELIWVYDRERVPRGIFPRAAFYTTEYARYSVWGFVINRSGKILLQRRSLTTADNRGLWDKSVGGHVDLEDASTALTAKRELVEEMYLPKAEFTAHMRADVGSVLDFGEWNPRKRPERSFREAFASLGSEDWVLFRATKDSGEPLTIDRVSERLWFEGDKPPRIRRTVFISDVYFFIAPPGALEDEESVSKNLIESEEGASSAHRLVTVEELRRWIDEVEESGDPKTVFTDDIIYMMLQHRGLLESITSFSNYLFGKES